MSPHTEFELVCVNCNSLGVRFDFAEGAPPSTPIRCGHCNALRGTLGHLRKLANSGERELLALIGAAASSVW